MFYCASLQLCCCYPKWGHSLETSGHVLHVFNTTKLTSGNKSAGYGFTVPRVRKIHKEPLYACFIRLTNTWNEHVLWRWVCVYVYFWVSGRAKQQTANKLYRKMICMFITCIMFSHVVLFSTSKLRLIKTGSAWTRWLLLAAIVYILS